MKRLLVIGANSYIGKNLYSYININKKEEISVHMVSASNNQWKSVDFSQYTSVLLLSAIVHKKEKKKLENLYFQVNHLMAVEIAKKAKENNVSQFIFMSTAAVYGDKVTRITKDTNPFPVTYYGMSKLFAEQDITRLQSEKFKAAIVRPPMVCGIECKGNYTKLIQLAKYISLFPEIHNKRSVISIAKLVEYITDLVIQDKGGVFHPQDKEYMDTCQLVKSVRDNMGKKIYFFRFSNPLFILLSHRVKIFNKLFSDFFYERDLQ